MLTSIHSYSPHLSLNSTESESLHKSMNTPSSSLSKQTITPREETPSSPSASTSHEIEALSPLKNPSSPSNQKNSPELEEHSSSQNQNTINNNKQESFSSAVEPLLFEKTLHQQEEANSDLELQEIKDRLHQVMNMSTRVLQRSMLGDFKKEEEEFKKKPPNLEEMSDDEEEFDEEHVEAYHSEDDFLIDEKGHERIPEHEEDNTLNGETKGEFDEHLNRLYPSLRKSNQQQHEFRSSSTQPTSSFTSFRNRSSPSSSRDKDLSSLNHHHDYEQEEEMEHLKPYASVRSKSQLVPKEDTEPKHYYRIATMSTGMVFMINSFMLYFGGQGKIQVAELYGFHQDSPHLQRTVAILFFVMGVINLAPNLFGGEEGFSLRNAAEYFPFLIAVLNVVVATHYVVENFRQGETLNVNWISLSGLVLFIVLNIKLATLSHPGAKIKVKRSEYFQQQQQMKYPSNNKNQ
ncbi:hypothetical protein FDP41_009188 [Naegleria fowleri]|uniref:Uncharacterized protein n=1 Tax=Naegleria fowleri TaxID=5763 RepID=A0A6A5BDX1_NAEFO|nr:uncharacterized protein FDP41_009188 [Naegleria fowleri]KAF0972285.1 hypothetical protein FDP41_009188 [Naegleria fowleri]